MFLALFVAGFLWIFCYVKYSKYATLLFHKIDFYKNIEAQNR